MIMVITIIIRIIVLGVSTLAPSIYGTHNLGIEGRAQSVEDQRFKLECLHCFPKIELDWIPLSVVEIP